VTLFRYSEKVNEFTAYKGEKFTIEWYFDENGKSDVLNYFEKLPDSLKIKTLVLFKRFADVGEIKDKTKFNFEGDALFAFKPKPHRFLCFFIKGHKTYNYGLPQRLKYRLGLRHIPLCHFDCRAISCQVLRTRGTSASLFVILRITAADTLRSGLRPRSA
jgi:hypothetical protein